MDSELHLSEMGIRLDEGDAQHPATPVLERFKIAIAPAAFAKIVQQAVWFAAERAPVQVDLASARLVDGGAEIVIHVKRSILKAQLRIRLGFTIPDTATIRVRAVEVDAPAWVPAQFVIDHGLTLAVARPGFSRVADDPRAIDLNPAVMLSARGLPLALGQPGAWEIDSAAGSLKIGYGPV